jgi:hypothetical protein
MKELPPAGHPPYRTLNQYNDLSASIKSLHYVPRGQVPWLSLKKSQGTCPPGTISERTKRPVPLAHSQKEPTDPSPWLSLKKEPREPSPWLTFISTQLQSLQFSLAQTGVRRRPGTKAGHRGIRFFCFCMLLFS